MLEYQIADKEQAEQVYRLVQATIQKVYPMYYPQEVVGFFSDLHSREKIASDIQKGRVRVLLQDGRLVGTGSCIENHISRLFVIPDSQNLGLGSYIMECLENELFASYEKMDLDSSLAAACFYEHRGYRTCRHEEIRVSDTAKLVYEIMGKYRPIC